MSIITYGNIRIPTDLEVNTLTASSGIKGDVYGTASFASDSDKLDGKDSSEFALVTDLSDFATRLEVSGAITGALEPYATLAGVSASFTTPEQVSGALEPYALSTDVSSSFVSHTQATASLARLAANNTFTGINTFNSAVTGSNALFTGNLNVNGTASISLLNTVESNHLKIGDRYITILSGSNTQASLDGSGILFGSGSSETPTNDQQSVASILYRNDAADGKIEIFPGLRVTGSIQATGGITGSVSGTLIGPAGGILSGTYPNPSGLKANSSNIIPLASYNGGGLPIALSANENSSVYIYAGTTPALQSAPEIRITSSQKSFTNFGTVNYGGGDVSITAGGDLNFKTHDGEIYLYVGNKNFTAGGIHIEAFQQTNETFQDTDVNIGARSTRIKDINIGTSNYDGSGGGGYVKPRMINLGSPNVVVSTQGKDMRRSQVLVPTASSTIMVRSATINLKPQSNITMSAYPAIKADDFYGTYAPNGCRVTLINTSNNNSICFVNDYTLNSSLNTSSVSIDPWVNLSSSLKLGAPQRVLAPWGTLELQYHQSGSAAYDGGFWVETNFSNNLTGSYDLSPYATISGVSGAIANFPTRSEVSGAITGALSPYALSSNVSSSFVSNVAATASLAFLTASNTFTQNQRITGSVFVLNAVSASSFTGSFKGDGSLITNIPSGAVDLSAYATLTGVSASFTTPTQVSSSITGALSTYATLTGVSSSFTTPTQVSGAITGALNPYALSSAVSSSFVSHTQATASLARLSANNTFTGTFNTFQNVIMSGSLSQGYNALTIATYSHAEGYGTQTYGPASHAEGLSSRTNGEYSHAEGVSTEASGNYSHAEGNSSRAYGGSSHAEGFNTLAFAPNSHAEGHQTIALRTGSHSEGLDTIAFADYQHVQGRYNAQNSTALMVVGNGPDAGNRSNILEVYTDSVNILGKIISQGQSVLNGGQIVKVSSKIANYALTASSDYILTFSGSNLTGTLPSASICNGSTFIIKNKHSSPLYITSSGGNIDGNGALTINTQYYSYTLVSDGTDWNII